MAKLTTALMVVLAISSSFSAAQTNPRVSHGTINIFLANSNGLVAVTDSRLTGLGCSAKSNSSQKLFQLDSTTIATVADNYAACSKNGDLVYSIDAVMSGYADYLKAHPEGRLGVKLQSLVLLSRSYLDTVATVQHMENPQTGPPEKLELTIAGYDEDQRINIAAVDLVPRLIQNRWDFEPQPRTDSQMPPCAFTGTPSIEAPETRVIAKHFVCVIAGITDYANKILSNPADRADQGFDVYARMKVSGKLDNLTVDDLTRIATNLEGYTADNAVDIKSGMHPVGGKVQIAILKNSDVLYDPPNFPVPTLPKINVANATVHADEPSPNYHHFAWLSSANWRFISVDSSANNMRVVLDQTYVGFSTFTNDLINYNGTGPFFFGNSNVVKNCSLELNNVDPNVPDVRQLMTGFTWTDVTVNGKKWPPAKSLVSEEELNSAFQGQLRRNPDPAQAHYNLGNAFFDKGDFADAINEYREGLALNLRNAAIMHYNLGLALANTGFDDDAAESEYARAISLEPRFDMAHNNLGSLYAKRGQFEAAIAQYRIAITLNPNVDKFHHNLAKVLADSGNIDDCVNELETVLNLNPNYPHIREDLDGAKKVRDSRQTK